MFRRKPKVLTPEQMEEIRTKDFFDMILPGNIKFFSDHYIMGDSYRSVWVIREYPPSTEEQAILSQLADRNGVTLRIYHRLVESMEQRKILQNATRKNKLMSGGNNVNETIEAEGNLQDVIELLANLRKNKEPLLHCSVFIELKARNMNALKELQSEISMELTRSKISVDRLTLRQKEGFLSVLPVGINQFGAQYERVLPASSVANLYPFNFSGKTDPQGLYLGRDKYGTNILVDFDRRAEDKTTSNILILGNSGQGKSYLLKLILTNIRESGKTIICLDPESEYEELTEAMGGCYIDFMSGEYTINPLEPKAWSDSTQEMEADAPEAFRKVTRLSQHIAFLKDFFRSYKDLTDAQVDTIEILLMKLYARFGITDSTDYSTKKPADFPVMSDFYELCEEEFMTYDNKRKYLYTEEMLQEVCLGIHSMCVGAESKYFNGHTNIVDDKFVCFGVKGLMDTNKRLKDAMLFNILSYMSNELLGKGNTAASIDELYLFLTNMTAIEYIRNAMKRVRKKESAIILASQNIEDFLIPSIREFTKPLFSIPTHQFLFNAGQINPKDFMDALQVEPSEFELIKYPERGTCLYRCGNERYLLQVIAPDYKSALFGKAGGR
ncbi:protein TraC [Lachnospiraceae bacterium]|nr:protein TraC [Lachnospiraceae bacterium]